LVTNRVDPQLAEKLESHGVTVTGAGRLVATLLSWVAPAVIFYLVWMYSGCTCFVMSPIVEYLAD
jgi:cell division protease FtsH